MLSASVLICGRTGRDAAGAVAGKGPRTGNTWSSPLRCISWDDPGGGEVPSGCFQVPAIAGVMAIRPQTACSGTRICFHGSKNCFRASETCFRASEICVHGKGYCLQRKEICLRCKEDCLQRKRACLRWRLSRLDARRFLLHRKAARLPCMQICLPRKQFCLRVLPLRRCWSLPHVLSMPCLRIREISFTAASVSLPKWSLTPKRISTLK
jgi:hypothetical protein